MNRATVTDRTSMSTSLEVYLAFFIAERIGIRHIADYNCAMNVGIRGVFDIHELEGFEAETVLLFQDCFVVDNCSIDRAAKNKYHKLEL